MTAGRLLRAQGALDCLKSALWLISPHRALPSSSCPSTRPSPSPVPATLGPRSSNPYVVGSRAASRGSRTTQLGETGKPVKVLTRSAATQLDKDVAARPNVTLAPVDYSSEASLVDALRGVDVVVSTLNGPGFAAQTDLIRAAKKADVKLFVASQFGIPVNGLEGTVMSAKVEANKLTKEIGLPSAQFATGPFMEFLRLCVPLSANDNQRLTCGPIGHSWAATRAARRSRSSATVTLLCRRRRCPTSAATWPTS